MSAFTPAQTEAQTIVQGVLEDHPRFVQSVGLLEFSKTVTDLIEGKFVFAE